MELYVAAARDLPLSFTGPIAYRVYVGASTKFSWASGAVPFDKFCAWDYRNNDHVMSLGAESTTSFMIEVFAPGKDERVAGVVFCKEGAFEGWQKLVVGGKSASAVMGSLYVRVGPKLSTMQDAAPLPAVNLDEAFPTFDELTAIRMQPAPDESMSLGRVFSLSVSLCDVFRVRQFLVNGGSAKTPVIIARGITGAPLEAICANCPASQTRKKMRIEFDGGAYSRMRSSDDAVAIAQLLLLGGARHDARSVRWLYENAAASQGKQALMKVLDRSFYAEGPPRPKKKKGTKAAAASAAPASPDAAGGWKSQAAPQQVSRQPSNLQLGGKRGKKGRGSAAGPEETEEERKVREAQEALSRPSKPIPLIPDSEDEANPGVADGSGMKGSGFFPRGDDDSDDLEEESSEDDTPVPAARPILTSSAAARKPVPQVPEDDDDNNNNEEPQQFYQGNDRRKSVMHNIEQLMEDIESGIEEEAQAQDRDSRAEGDNEQSNIRDSLRELLSAHDDKGEEEEANLPLDHDGQDPGAAEQSLVMDWVGVYTDSFFEIGEEFNEETEKIKEKNWKRPPSMLFRIVKKNDE